MVSSVPRHWPSERTSLLRMLGMLRHRGPDQFGIYGDDLAALGSARLSIIDLANGQQPIANHDQSLWIVFNGEIFNYIELRRDLVRGGAIFRTDSDTEVLLQLYERYGEESLSRLNGQFAFAIWDRDRRRLFAARDRLGVRPFFYTQRNGALLFASEIKALLTYPGVSAEMNADALAEIFTYWCPTPGNTAFKGIQELPAGHHLSYADGDLKIRQYWALRFGVNVPTQPEPLHASAAVEQLKEILSDATRIRLRSDVPVGAYLSGGLDSSLIARITANQAPRQVSTFSIAFDDPDFDESEHQMRMARILGTRHEIVHATYGVIAKAFLDVVWHTETPVTRTAPAPMYVLSRLVRNSGFKVVLTGEGADEFLAGYDLFKEALIRRFWARAPNSAVRPLLLRRLYADIPGLSANSADVLRAFFSWRLHDVESPFYSHAIRWRNTARIRRFFSAEMAAATTSSKFDESPKFPIPAEFSGWEPLQRAQYLEATLFLPQYLLSSQGDRVAMAHSVETRHPFLDYRLVEWANALPCRLKMNGLKDKYVLRQLGRELLPSEVWQRPKRPYRAPISRSLFGPELREEVLHHLSPKQLEAAGYFSPAAVSRLIAKLDSPDRASETDDMAIAGILSAQIWHHRFVANFRADAPISGQDDLKECGPAYATVGAC